MDLCKFSTCFGDLCVLDVLRSITYYFCSGIFRGAYVMQFMKLQRPCDGSTALAESECWHRKILSCFAWLVREGHQIRLL